MYESHTMATASISTFAFSGNVLTAKQARAGGSSGKYLPVVTSQEHQGPYAIVFRIISDVNVKIFASVCVRHISTYECITVYGIDLLKVSHVRKQHSSLDHTGEGRSSCI